VAEDTAAPKCKRGHVRIPNTSRQCSACHRERQARYRASGQHGAVQARYEISEKGRATSARYRATAKRWVVYRRHQLRGQREAVQAKLGELEREERECLTYLGSLTQTR
jgi:hypothetical protein